jgi:Ni2+-binding GTPase involved in maturation of urease and hydrogenase
MSNDAGTGTTLHLVGGFLGSGKTTGIIAAAKQLMAAGQQVGVVTNDQGKYLVDTAFVRLADLPAVEVTGGCFCCNYNDLNQQLVQLIDEAHPDVVFAESVGSCADIVATVVKPLLTLGDARLHPSSYSVFVDSRLLLRRVQGQALPFSEDVVYIFDQQIEEAGLLVLNKADLLSKSDRNQLVQWADGRDWRFQNSLSAASVNGWVEILQDGRVPLPLESLDIDYKRYGRGEAQMAWLDETLHLEVPSGQGREVLAAIITELLAILRKMQVAIGHLKFVLKSGNVSAKLSFTGLEAPGWSEALPAGLGGEVQVLVNMRAETEADRLHAALRQALSQAQQQIPFVYQETKVAFFHPTQPRPTHRLG